MEKRICVVFTGGTIGSVEKGGIVNVDESTKYALIEKYRKQEAEFRQRFLAENADGDKGEYGKEIGHFAYNVQFETLSPYFALSENISRSNLEALLTTVKAVCEGGKADGIVICHGTDTLAYTSSFLWYALQVLNIPVVLIAADAPLDSSEGNGLTNFHAAVKFICECGDAGVFVAYANKGEAPNIHIGARLMQARQLDGRFDSIYGLSYAYLDGGRGSVNGAMCRTLQSIAPKFPVYGQQTAFLKREGTKKCADTNNFFELENIKIENDVLYIRAHALQNFKLYSFEKSPENAVPKAVVVELYHSGTVDTANEYSFLEFADYCNSFGIDVIVAPFDGSIYAGKEKLFAKENIIPICGIGIEAALMKTMIAYGTFTDKNRRKQYLQTKDFEN